MTSEDRRFFRDLFKPLIAAVIITTAIHAASFIIALHVVSK